MQSNIKGQYPSSKIEKKDNTLLMHHNSYFNSLNACKGRMDDIDEINRIRKFFMDNKVKIVKFNNSLDSRVQRFTQFDAYMQLEELGQFIKFVNIKPIDDPKYILEADPE